MASNKLTKNWIQYLKNNQIVALQSDPKSGKLNYKRPVTSSDVVNFLQTEAGYDDDSINSAIEQALGNKKPQPEPEQTQQDEPQTPEQIRKQKQAAATQRARGEMNDRVTNTNSPAPQQQGDAEQIRKQKQAAAAKSAQQNMAGNPLPEPKQQPETPEQIRQRKLAAATKLARSDMTDIEPEPAPVQQQKQGRSQGGGKKSGELSQTPGAIRKRQARANRKAALNEDFVDDPGEELSERDVEAVFAALNGGNSGSGKTQSDSNQQENPAEEEKIHGFITNKMSSAHRKQLWDLLQGNSLNESTIDERDVGYILQNAARSRRIDIEDLKSQWKQINYSTDSDEIAEMLHNKFHFSEQDINDIFTRVLRDYDSQDDDSQNNSSDESYNPAVTKLADYIKKNNMTKSVITFMQSQFGNELTSTTTNNKPGLWQKAKNFGNKLMGRQVTHEDVRKIFTLMLKECNPIIKHKELTQLGRNKK